MYQLDEDQKTDEPIETLHIYVFPENEASEQQSGRSSDVRDCLLIGLSLVALTLSILALCLLPTQPEFEVQTIGVPAKTLPPVTLTASASVIPTGVKTYPATAASGTLTLYNGSILTQDLPAGFILSSSNGVEIVTTASVTVPAGSPPNYGVAQVAARAAQVGASGNIAAYALNSVYGASLYIKNLSSFAGGKDAKTVHFVTEPDTTKANLVATIQLHTQLQVYTSQHTGQLERKCLTHQVKSTKSLSLRLTCQFVSYAKPVRGQLLSAQLRGNQVVLRVRSVVSGRPVIMPIK